MSKQQNLEDLLEANQEMLVYDDNNSNTVMYIFAPSKDVNNIIHDFDTDFKKIFSMLAQNCICAEENGIKDSEEVLEWVDKIYPLNQAQVTDFGCKLTFDNLCVNTTEYDDEGDVVDVADGILIKSLQMIQKKYPSIAIHGCIAYLYTDWEHGPSSTFRALHMPSKKAKYDLEDSILIKDYEEIKDNTLKFMPMDECFDEDLNDYFI